MNTPLTQFIQPDLMPLDFQGYERAGGYAAARKALKEMTPQALVQLVKDSRLRGRGGAGFPTGLKWSFIPQGPDSPRPKYLVANADEMEPGTFKDRLLMESAPHHFVEGLLITSFAIQADVAYVFIRGEYKVAQQRMKKAIHEAYAAGLLGKNILGTGYNLELFVHASGGRYICGEETALLNALEGKRATPRSKPPFPPVVGLFGKPTVVQNVETICNVPPIVANGVEWYKKLSRSDDGGTKLYGISGKVKKPGLWELPLGVTVREVIEEHGGGMRDGLRLRGFLPGGASTQFLKEEHLDTPMDFVSMEKAGSRLGTGTMILMDDRTCPVGMLHNLEHFFAQESCGWCTPCREGLPWTEKVLHAMEHGEGQDGDIERLEKHCHLLGPGFTFCALAPGAMEPLVSALRYFRDDFERHIREKRCSYKER